jgi:nucleolar protein 56
MFASINACGIYLCDEKTCDFIFFSDAEQFLMLKRGEKIPELVKIIEKYEEIIFEQKNIAEIFEKPCKFPNPAGIHLRTFAIEFAEKNGINLKERMREVSLYLTRKSVKESSEKKDKLIVESVRALDEIDQVLNVLSERLREWYSLYYPELDKRTKDNFAYAKRIHQGMQKKDSMGATLEPKDEDVIRTFAQNILDLFEERKRLEEYITVETQKIAPNMSSLLGAVLSARLMSSAGGLEELARLPSSTIQVLGAEKALFRHLRTGAKPPKHGLIFQHPLVNRAPRKLRGKISRSLAAKIAIVARVDCYSSGFVAEEVEEQIQERISRIKGEMKARHTNERRMK